MGKRKHSAMIKAWADNEELSVFVNYGTNWELLKSSPNWCKFNEYYLCLPKHKDAVLELLNGGNAQVLVENKNRKRPYWSDCAKLKGNEWDDEWWYMNEDIESRIKPKKETRYAYVYPDGYTSRHAGSIEELKQNFHKEDGQLITFEIEI